MLQPSRTKYRKQHKGRIHGSAKGGTSLNFGAFGLKAMEPERVTARQIEAARRAITRGMKRAGRVWIRIFPDIPVTKKPIEVRMGSGKALARAVDRARQAGPHHVRAGRCVGSHCARGASARRGEAADQDAHRAAPGVGGERRP
jgi:ribosomal protein L16